MIGRLDMGALEFGDLAPLRVALEESGAAYLSNHSVPARVLDAAFDACQQLHAMDREAKEAVAVGRNGFARGWHEGRQAGKGSYESFEIGPALAARKSLDATEVLLGPNVWPPWGGYREAAEEYFAAMESLSQRLMPLIERTFSLPDDYLARRTRAPCSLLRMLRYEASEVDAAPGIDAHTDFELFTLISEDHPGLEVCDRVGNWHLLRTAGRNELILLAGDLLEVATGGRAESPLHRVALSPVERRSLVFFCGMDVASVVSPVAPPIRGAKGRSYPSLNVGEHLAAMYALTYPHLKAAYKEGRLPGIVVPAHNPFKQYKLERGSARR